jgi:predicted AlkP superfamily pyrophosphatase or phosphodiesterase
MLPALTPGTTRLADVLESSSLAASGLPSPLGLAPVDHALLVLVDGLGAEALKAAGGHARTLSAASSRRATIESGFPTTTAAALGSLATGAAPGAHGLVGYTVLDPDSGRLLNQLSGLEAHPSPQTWQRAETVFARARLRGIRTVAIGDERYRSSALTAALWADADYLAGRTIAERFDRAREFLAGPGGVGYLYIPELDMAGHAHGGQSSQWMSALEEVDGAVRALLPAISPRTGMLLTADHGMVDVAAHQHVLIPPALLDGVRFVAGEPRCLQLHLEPGASIERVLERWRTAEGARAWVVGRDEAVAAGWFGELAPGVGSRIGDVLVAARKNIAYYDPATASASARAMVGQHGSWSSAELRVPLLRWGAFAAG